LRRKGEGYLNIAVINPAMAGENSCRYVDVFVLDNKPDLQYVQMLRDLGYNVELVADLKNRDKLYSTDAKVLIFGYALGHKEGSGAIECTDSGLQESMVTGAILAKCVSEWDDGVKRYVHIVSSHAVEKKPPFSELSWEEMKKQGIINSYSTREPESFGRHIEDIVKATE
jgi:hypothetical protein